MFYIPCTIQSVKCTGLRSDVDSILEAVLTVSPNKQYRGIVRPTTPATTGPVSINGRFIIYRERS